MPSAAAEAPPAYSYGPDTTVIGAVSDCTVSPGESLIEIARRHGLGYNEITTANPGKDPFVPPRGARVVVPAMWILPDLKNHDGIIINLAEMRLYYFFQPGGLRRVITFPVGIGREGYGTPEGKFKVIEKTAISGARQSEPRARHAASSASVPITLAPQCG
jgi:L,D-transpeptidase ErfK/SrfK